MTKAHKEISENDLNDLKTAKALLENKGVANKITNLLGNPIQKSLDILPKNWNEKLSDITTSSLLKAADAAIFTMKNTPNEKSSNTLHKIATGASGALGGLFGIAGLSFELPITTTIMLRSVADIARSHGESISDTDTKFACLGVFALGGHSIDNKTLESGYYATKTVLSNSMKDLGRYITEQGIVQEGSPLFLKFISNIAERFGLQITEKVIAQSVPIIGAAGGAIINTIFMEHFQSMAEGHFTVRKLERKYGKDLIKKIYNTLT